MKTLLPFIAAFLLLGCNLHVEQVKEWPAKPKELSAKERRLKLLEEELGQFPNVDSDSISLKKRKKSDEILALDPFNDLAIRETSELCRELANSFDTCSSFFENLIKKYPNNPRAYLVKAKYSPIQTDIKDPEKLKEFWLISSLKGLLQAIEIDSNYYDTNYELAIVYYKLFLQRPSQEYASNARNWFMKAADIRNEERAILKFPIIQLSTYLKDNSSANDYAKFTYQIKTKAKGVPDGNRHNWYFPVEPFLELKQNWKSDSTLDFIREIKNAAFVLDWYSGELNLYQEPMISAGYKCDVYRFLLIRSFYPPVVFRMERNDGRVSIRWKKCYYNQKLDAYEFGEDHTKPLSNPDWDNFEEMLAKANYWEMPISDDHGSTDGAQWVMEAWINGKYKIAESNKFGTNYEKCIRYLMSLADLGELEGGIY